MGDDRSRGGYLDGARAIAASVIVLAGLAAVIGCVLDWVTIEPAAAVRGDFGDTPFRLERVSEPFAGIETREGKIVAGAALALLGCAALVVATRRRAYAWLALLAAMTIGGLSGSVLRAVDETASSVSRQMDVVGDPDPAVGILLVITAAVLGVIGSAGALAATPSSPRLESFNGSVT